MSNGPTCQRCGKPIHDQAFVCVSCTGPARDALRLLAKIAGEGSVTISRLDEFVTGGPGEPDELDEPPAAGERPDGALAATALPWRPGAAARYDRAVNELVTTARHIAEESGEPLPTVRRAACPHHSCAGRRAGRIVGPVCGLQLDPEHPLERLATWLVGRLEWIRKRAEARELLDGITAACGEIEGVVDRPAERWYAGVCGASTMEGECKRELWPAAGAKTFRCACGGEHDLDKRKAAMLAEADDQWATAAWCAHRLTSLGVPCTPEMVHGYAHRKRLAPHPDPDPRGYPRYRLASVRELVEETAAARREAALRKAVRAAERAERERQRERAMA